MFDVIWMNGFGAVFMTQLVFFVIAFMEMFILFIAVLGFTWGIRLLFNVFV